MYPGWDRKGRHDSAKLDWNHQMAGIVEIMAPIMILISHVCTYIYQIQNNSKQFYNTLNL